MLKVENLKISFPGCDILNNISFQVRHGDWLMIVGPNGAGKSTIASAITQSLAYDGKIYFEGQDIKTIRHKDRAKLIGILMQNNNVQYSFTVRQIVALGRFSYSSGIFKYTGEADDKKIDEALKAVNLYEKRNQSVLTLSGGEVQRTFLAQVLCQDPKLLILDEPTNHLDITFQESIFELIKKWLSEDNNRDVISIVHDLSLAKMYGSKAIMLKNGNIFAMGEINKIMSKDNLKKVYGIDVYEWQKKLFDVWKK